MKDYNQLTSEKDCILPSSNPFIESVIGYMDMDGVMFDERGTTLSIHCKYIIGSVLFLNGCNGFWEILI
jgi:hypothetical protein